MKKITNQVLLVAVLSFILNGCVPSPSPTATPTALMPTKASPTATAPETDGSTSDFSQPITAVSGTLILQEDNPLPKTRLVSKDSGDLDDNRIASHWQGLWAYDPISHLLNETLHIGVKRYRLSINNGDQDKVDWTKPEFSVDPSHDEFITNLANNGIQITYFLSFWDKANYPDGVGAPCPRFKTEEEIERYLEFARFIVGHFKDRVQIYEIYNEPDIHACPQWIEVKDYINLVRRAVPVIREEYPDAKIQVGGVADLSNPGTQDYLFSILESDIMPLVDIISWHPFYGSSPVTDPAYYYAYPTIVQKIKDTAASHGFTGEYAAEEMNWRPASDPDPDHPSPYSELESAKYQIRGIIMHLGMDVIAGNLRIPSDPPPWPHHYVESTFAVRNLSTVMAGATLVDLPYVIESDAINIKNYWFTLSNGDKLLALWIDDAAVDDDPGIPITLTFPDFSTERVTGLDVLNGFEQQIVTEDESGNLVIHDFLVKDYPILIKFNNASFLEKTELPTDVDRMRIQLQFDQEAIIREKPPVDVFVKLSQSELTTLTNSQINLTLSWGTKTSEQIDDFLSNIECKIILDGESLPNVMDYWGQIEKNDSGIYSTTLQYPVGKLDLGSHLVEAEITSPVTISDGYGEYVGTIYQYELRISIVDYP